MRLVLDDQAKDSDGCQLWIVEWYLPDGSLRERYVFAVIENALSWLRSRAMS